MSLYSVKAETQSHVFHAMVNANEQSEVLALLKDCAESTGLGIVDESKVQIYKSISDSTYVYDIKKK